MGHGRAWFGERARGGWPRGARDWTQEGTGVGARDSRAWGARGLRQRREGLESGARGRGLETRGVRSKDAGLALSGAARALFLLAPRTGAKEEGAGVMDPLGLRARPSRYRRCSDPRLIARPPGQEDRPTAAGAVPGELRRAR